MSEFNFLLFFCCHTKPKIPVLMIICWSEAFKQEWRIWISNAAGHTVHYYLLNTSKQSYHPPWYCWLLIMVLALRRICTVFSWFSTYIGILSGFRWTGGESLQAVPHGSQSCIFQKRSAFLQGGVSRCDLCAWGCCTFRLSLRLCFFQWHMSRTVYFGIHMNDL